MTIAALADFIGTKLRRSDTDSVEAAKAFLRVRHGMIWDSWDWPDARALHTVAVAASGAEIEMPGTVEHVIGLRWGASDELLAVQAETVLATDAAAFDRLGRPVRFTSGGKTPAGARLVRLYNVPEEAGSVLVLAKQKAPVLADTDEPTLAGVQQALLAFAEADMLERQRQYAKAQAKYSEANALLESMREQSRNLAQTSIQIVPYDGGHLGRDDLY